MRLPVVPQVSTKDGISNKNARLTNTLKETAAQGEFAVVRPGLENVVTSSGSGNGLVCFGGELVSVYGATLGVGIGDVDLTPTVSQYTQISNFTALSVVFANGKYVAVGGDTPLESSKIFYSSDGQSWSPALHSGLAIGLTPIVWNGSIFCTVGSDSGSEFLAAYTSSDGVTWSQHTISVTDWFETDYILVWTGTVFVLQGDGFAYRSSNGSTWTGPYAAGMSIPQDAVAGIGAVVTVGKDEVAPYYLVYTSLDNGLTFSPFDVVASDTSTRITSVLFDGTYFYAIGQHGSPAITGAFVYRSSNGYDFYEVADLSSFTSYLCKIAWNGEVFFATCVNGAYAASVDGEIWTEFAGSGLTFYCLTPITGGFLALTTTGIPVKFLVDATASIPTVLEVTNKPFDFAQSPL